MSRALVSLAVGEEHERFLEIAYPSREEFAELHGYELLEPVVASTRPPSWWKVPALAAALDAGYTEVLWLDTDVVIVDATDDLEVAPEFWQALVEHRTGDGAVPNCGVWLVRQPMRPFLDQLWAQVNRINHGWWEQAAMLDMLGYRHQPRPSRLEQPTGLYERTCWLDNGWNVHPWDTPGPEHPRFMHATMHPDRLERLEAWARGELPEVPDTPCRHLYDVDTGMYRCPYCYPATVTA